VGAPQEEAEGSGGRQPSQKAREGPARASVGAAAPDVRARESKPELMVPKKEGLAEGGFSDLIEHRSFWGSGRPPGGPETLKKIGTKAPYLFKGFLGRPGPPRTPK